MADLNTCTFTGHLTDNAQSRVTTTGSQVTNFKFACNTGWGDYASTLFITGQIWGKNGESLLPYLLKGKHIGASGELKEESWTDQAGIKRTKLVLNNAKVILMPDKHQVTEVQPEMSF